MIWFALSALTSRFTRAAETREVVLLAHAQTPLRMPRPTVIRGLDRTYCGATTMTANEPGNSRQPNIRVPGRYSADGSEAVVVEIGNGLVTVFGALISRFRKKRGMRALPFCGVLYEGPLRPFLSALDEHASKI